MAQNDKHTHTPNFSVYNNTIADVIQRKLVSHNKMGGSSLINIQDMAMTNKEIIIIFEL